MRKPKSFLRVLTDTGPLVALAVAIALLVGIVGPASAQFFNFGGAVAPGARASGGGWFGGDFFAAVPAAGPQAPRQDYSRAPPPDKRDPLRAGTQRAGARRRHGRLARLWPGGRLHRAARHGRDPQAPRPISGLIKYQPRGDPADWTAAAKGILATEKPDAIVVMLGLNDRHARSANRQPDKKTDKKDDKKDARAKPGDAKRQA